MAKASILDSVTSSDHEISVVIYHTDAASFSRSVDVLARKAFADKYQRKGYAWSRVRMSADYAHSYDEARAPHRCISTITFTRMY